MNQPAGTWCPRFIPKLEHQGLVTAVTTGANFYVGPLTLPLELQECSKNISVVMGHGSANGAMLRRSVQLLLVAENEHFDGCMHLMVWEHSCNSSGKVSGST